MPVNPIPEKVVNYNLYKEGNRLLGVTGEVTLPNLEAMTETVSGPGIAGEYESPTPGHFGSMEIEIPYRTLSGEATSFMPAKTTTITLRASQQVNDTAAGETTYQGVKITMKVAPKNFNLGTMGVGQPTESANTLEVLYIKIDIDGETKLEYDKLNFIFSVDGEDQLAQVREQI
jgi:hypothetical protein